MGRGQVAGSFSRCPGLSAPFLLCPHISLVFIPFSFSLFQIHVFLLFPLPGPTLIQTHLLVCISVVVVMILTLVSPLPFANPAPIFWP